MRLFMRHTIILFALPTLTLAAASIGSGTAFAAQAGTWTTAPCGSDQGNTENNSWWGHKERACELRTTTLKLDNPRLAVKSENGGIEIVGEDRGDVIVEARVQAWARSLSESKEMVSRVVIETSGGSIRDNIPHSFHLGGPDYGVNYRIRVPRRLAVDLHSMNGGIDISHLEGDIHFDTTNGGVDLNDLAGNVHGSTVNGGLDIELTGDHWRGQGLNAETTNGGVSLKVPDRYNARLETATVNGGIEVNFPITLQGEIKNRISTTLGSGGATIHAETTNGGVEIERAAPVTATR